VISSVGSVTAPPRTAPGRAACTDADNAASAKANNSARCASVPDLALRVHLFRSCIVALRARASRGRLALSALDAASRLRLVGYRNSLAP
jgi:hypothetical protein